MAVTSRHETLPFCDTGHTTGYHLSTPNYQKLSIRSQNTYSRINTLSQWSPLQQLLSILPPSPKFQDWHLQVCLLSLLFIPITPDCQPNWVFSCSFCTAGFKLNHTPMFVLCPAWDRDPGLLPTQEPSQAYRIFW